MRIVFMGTPDFSVPALNALVDAGHEVAAVVTQPDRPKGRGKDVQMTPVKLQALEYGIPVYQPEKVKDPAFVEILKELHPEAIVVIAFGQILSKAILDIPPYGCVNIHASLLPKYRGAAPIQWAMIPLDPKETGGSLFEKLSQAGGKLILSTLDKLEKGTAVRTPQKDEDSTYAKMLTKSLGRIDWSMEAEAIERLIRGLNPWPSAYTSLHGKTLKLWDGDVLKETTDARPGEVVLCDPRRLVVAAGEGLLSIRQLQLEGKKRMDVETFLRGYSVKEGEILGE